MGSTMPLATMPSYFPVPVTFSRTILSPCCEKLVRRLSPSGSTASHTVFAEIFPSNEAFIPTHLKEVRSNKPPDGLLRFVPVISKLNAEWVFENAIRLLTPDQQAV